MTNSSIDRTLSDATPPGFSGPSNEEVLHISKSSKAGASLSDCLMSYSGYSLCRDAVNVFYSTSQMANFPLPSIITIRYYGEVAESPP